uniref:C-type lectin domain-containing protein n=1 Tax=Meloidogyne hapla TaxID=6305 RepID=A0A1I8B281_MELHA
MIRIKVRLLLDNFYLLKFKEGFPEDCVCMYKGVDGNINWNDISCYHKLGGVICKRQCNSESVGRKCGVNGWEAIATCQSLGAKVASIHSDQQQASVAKVSQIIQTNCSWIGLHRNAILGGQINNFWDDGSPSDYGIIVQLNAGNAPWSPGCPKSLGNSSCITSNDCVAVVPPSGFWLDLDCVSSCGAVICEKECNPLALI